MATQPPAVGGSIISQLLNDWHSYFESEKVGKKWMPFVNVKDYGAVGDGVADDTAAFNAALSSFVGVTVFVPIGIYKIAGQITVPRYAKLIGDRIGLTQGSGAQIDEGPNRVTKNISAQLNIESTDVNMTPIMMQDQSVVKGIATIYPNQNPANTTEANIIQYAPTFHANHGCNILDIRTWGAWDFIEGHGEALKITDIYGYNFGRGISIYDSADVCRLENIHLNPNVARPAQGLIDLAKSRPRSQAFYFENVDGLLMSNIHIFGYRTGVKAVGGTTNGFTMQNFFFDSTGLAFDIDTDSFWGVQMSNGTIVSGFSDSSSYAGFMKLNKTISQTLTVPILVSNISLASGSYGITPDYYITFDYLYGFDVQVHNLAFDNGATEFISNHGSYVSGSVRSANTEIHLEELYQKPNWIKNHNLQTDSSGDGVPDHWTIKDNGAGLTVSRDITGFMKISSNGVDDFEGVYNRTNLSGESRFTVIVKAREFNTRSNIHVSAFDSGFTNDIQDFKEFNSEGFAKITVTDPKQIVDVYISPGNNSGDSVVIEYVQLVTDTRGYLLG